MRDRNTHTQLEKTTLSVMKSNCCALPKDLRRLAKVIASWPMVPKLPEFIRRSVVFIHDSNPSSFWHDDEIQTVVELVLKPGWGIVIPILFSDLQVVKYPVLTVFTICHYIQKDGFAWRTICEPRSFEIQCHLNRFPQVQNQLNSLELPDFPCTKSFHCKPIKQNSLHKIADRFTIVCPEAQGIRDNWRFLAEMKEACSAFVIT